MTVFMAKQLGVLEAHDLGLTRLDSGAEPFAPLCYTSVLFWRCDKCLEVSEVTSGLERKFCLEMGLAAESLAEARLKQDLEAVRVSKEHHHCEPAPAGMSRVVQG